MEDFFLQRISCINPNDKWMHPILNELTPIIFNIQLTHLGSEAFIYIYIHYTIIYNE